MSKGLDTLLGAATASSGDELPVIEQDYKFSIHLLDPGERIDNMVRASAHYFKGWMKPSWLEDKLVQDMILDIDKSVVSGNSIDSPVLRKIEPYQLSSGVITLILILCDNTGKIFSLSNCGDNCMKWLPIIAERHTFEVVLCRYVDLPVEVYPIRISNDGRLVRNRRELLDAYRQFLRGGE